MGRAAHIAARRAYVHPLDARRQWRTLIYIAMAATDGRPVGDGHTPGTPMADLAHLISGIQGVDFPAEGISAALVAEAFTRLARAYLLAAIPQVRETYAPALHATAQALDGLIHEQLCAEAEGGRRVMGERD